MKTIEIFAQTKTNVSILIGVIINIENAFLIPLRENKLRAYRAYEQAVPGTPQQEQKRKQYEFILSQIALNEEKVAIYKALIQKTLDEDGSLSRDTFSILVNTGNNESVMVVIECGTMTAIIPVAKTTNNSRTLKKEVSVDRLVQKLLSDTDIHLTE